ncbi:MAG: phosphatidate cytidylyltransferase [Vulcanibacillus sp.]
MKERIITGIVGIVFFLSLVWLGDIYFAILILLIACVGFYEYLKINKIKLISLEGLWGLFIILLIFYDNNYIVGDNSISIVILLLLIYLVLVVASKNMITFENIGLIIVGVLYIGYGFSYMIETRNLDNGLILTIFILFSTWASDSGAYFFGKYFGKNKLWPVISPKKTIEGSVGGVVFAIIIGLIFNYFFNITSYLLIIFIAILISILGQLGDLIESALKRSKDVKDSGSLLPGHGGILDRFDSLIFIYLVLYLIQIF